MHTAALGGRLVTPAGNGLRGAIVTLTDAADGKTSVISNAFGYFEFEGLIVGRAYTVTVRSNRYKFPYAVVEVIDGMSTLDLRAVE